MNQQKTGKSFNDYITWYSAKTYQQHALGGKTPNRLWCTRLCVLDNVWQSLFVHEKDLQELFIFKALGTIASINYWNLKPPVISSKKEARETNELPHFNGTKAEMKYEVIEERRLRCSWINLYVYKNQLIKSICKEYNSLRETRYHSWWLEKPRMYLCHWIFSMLVQQAKWMQLLGVTSQVKDSPPPVNAASCYNRQLF